MSSGHWCRRCVLLPYCKKPQRLKQICYEFIPTHCERRMRLASQRLGRERKTGKLFIIQQYACVNCNKLQEVPKPPN